MVGLRMSSIIIKGCIYALEWTQTVKVGLVANHESRRLVRELDGTVLLEAN